MTTFSYTGAVQEHTINEAGDYAVNLRGANGNFSAGGTVSGTIFLELGTVVTFKVGQGKTRSTAGAQAGGWPDGGGVPAGGAYCCPGAGSTSMWVGGALIAIAGGGGGWAQASGKASSYGGGLIGGSGSAGASMNGGRQYAGGTGAPAAGGIAAAQPGSYLQGGSGSVSTYPTGGGGGFFGGGGGFDNTPGGGGSGWTGGLKNSTNAIGDPTGGTNGAHGSASIVYVGPNPSGTMPGIPLTIRVRASTDTCQVEKDITVRVLGYVVHDTFAIPSLVVGTPVSYQLPLSPGTGFAPIVWTTSGTLPTGLTLSAAGLLSGTPSAAATFNWSAITTDDSGAAATTAVESIVAAS